MNKLLLMLAVILPVFIFSGCSNDEETNEQETKIEVTQNEIQGSWHSLSYSYNHIYFDGNEYSYNIMDANGDEITHRENGTYTINGIDIVFSSEDGSSKLGNCEIYWEDDTKNYLHIYPVGSFMKAD